jgi:hypothetical protein
MADAVLSPVGHRLVHRRDFLGDLGSGLAGIALASLLAEPGARAADPIRPAVDPQAPLAPRRPHHPAKARRVLHVYCAGGCSQVDTWDYKPELVKRHERPLPGGEDVITHLGAQGNLIKSPYPFRPRGQCGKYVSDLLPNLAELVDEMCFIHSMTARASSHGPAEAQLNSGFTVEGYPSAGSWVSYALGTEQQNLPAFVALPDPRGHPQIGPASWSNGFLPAVFQGTAFTADQPITNLAPPRAIPPAAEGSGRDLLKLLNDEHRKRHPGDSALGARVASYELAARLQLSAPEVSDLAREGHGVRERYGVNDKDPLVAGFARNCLLARRLLERGVRFVQVFNGAYASVPGRLNWDAHNTLKSDYDRHGPVLDRPLAALLRDLKCRGLLEDTLVVWSTEFGRMPTFQQRTRGRDHNPRGFTVWLAGAGVRKGFSYGATDEFGYRAVDKVATIPDLHATLLHLLGLDHERLTWYHNGIERRLTDVQGRVLRGVLG